MTHLIDTTLPLKCYTAEQWEIILEHGSFRGHNIQYMKRKLETHPDRFHFDEEKVSLVYAKKNGELVELSLNKIKECKTDWSCSRFFYWIKTTLCCAEKTDVGQLATLIHNNLHPPRIKLPDSEEKLRWKEHKANAMNFSTLEGMQDAIPSETYNLINSVQTEDFEPLPISDAHKILLGKVVQAKEFNKETHYTFIHGQSLSYWVINQLLKELEKLKNPDQDVSLYHFLRLPGSELKTTRQEHIDNSLLNNFYDYHLGTELLSVDGSFFHEYGYESTNHFVRKNSSFLSSNQTTVITKILEKYSVYTIKDFNKIKNLCSQFNVLGSIGLIYAISIPKEKFSEYVYTAHNYGVACQCVSDNEQVQRIDDLQKHIAASHCDDHHIPQYRILTHFLNPEETPITLHTSVSKAQKDEFKRQIRELAEELYFQGVA